MREILKAADCELRKLSLDFLALTMLIGGPVLYLFYYPFPYSNEIVRDIPVAVVDEDNSQLSRQITRMLNSTESMKVTTEYSSVAQARNAFMERKVYAIINIPADFYKKVVMGDKPLVKLFSDGSYMIFYSAALTASMEIVLTAAAGVKIRQMTMQGIPTRDAYNLQSAANVISHPLFNPKGGYATFVSPAVYTLIIQQVFLIVLCLLQGTDYERGYRYPAGAGAADILIGKTLVYFIIFAAMTAYFFTVGSMVFNLPSFGKFLDMVLFMTPYGLSVIFFGLTMGYFAREREGAMLVALMSSIPFLFITGFLWPVWAMPEWIRGLRALIPSSAGVNGFVMIRQTGASLGDILPSYLNLWGLAFFYMFTALLVIKWQTRQPGAYDTETGNNR